MNGTNGEQAPAAPVVGNLLGSLEKGQDWVAQHDDPARGLADIVCIVGNRLKCDACSVYRLDGQQQALILTATVGLRHDCVEALQMKITEGLCGLVVQQRQPVSVASKASAHPRFKYFPEAGEEPYETFLGVPIIDGTQIVGVLVVQTIEPRQYTHVDTRSLTLIGRQIGPLVQQLRCQKETS